MIDWAALWLIVAATSWAATCVVLAALVRVLNRDRRAELVVTFSNVQATVAAQQLVAEWGRHLRGYERGRVTMLWPALAQALDALERARSQDRA